MRTYVRDGTGAWHYLPELVDLYDIDPTGKTDEQIVDEVNAATQPTRDWLSQAAQDVGRAFDALMPRTVDDLRDARNPLCKSVHA